MPRFALIFLFLIAIARADEVILRNGASFVGRIIEEEETYICLEVMGGKIRFERRDIAEIRREDDRSLARHQVADLLRVGAYEAARKAAEEALAAYPDDTGLKIALASSYLRQGARLASLRRHSEALAVLLEGRDRCPWSADELLAPIESAREALKSSQAVLDDALRLTEAEDWAQALELFQKLEIEAPLLIDAVARPFALCLVHLGDEALGRGSNSKAGDHYEQALITDPSLGRTLQERICFARGREIAGRVALGDLDGSTTAINRLRRQYPRSEVALYYAGMVALASGNRSLARAQFQQLFSRDPALATSRDLDALESAGAKVVAELLGQSVVRDSRTWAQVTSQEFAELKSLHFRLHHKNTAIAREVLAALEEAISGIGRSFGLKDLPEGISVYLYPDRESYQKVSGAHEWSGGWTTVACRGAVPVSRSISLLQTAPQLLDATVPHEVAHLLWYDALAGKASPSWLSEGVATLFESGYKKSHLRRRYARDAALERLEDLDTFLTRTGYPEGEDAVTSFYARSHVLTSYLVGLKGYSGLFSFCEKIGQNGTTEALRQVYGLSAEQWELRAARNAR